MIKLSDNLATKNLQSDFDNKLLLLEKNSSHNDALSIRYAIFSTITYGLSSFHMKLTNIIYDDRFDANLFVFWRSVGISILLFILSHYKSQRILKYSEINSKFWFVIRTSFSYLNTMFLILCIVEMRAATAACMSSASPAIIILMSIFILKEKFYLRYIIGIIICFIGTTLIVLNENNDDSHSIENEKIENKNIIAGVFFGVCHIIFHALVTLAQKIISIENIPIDTQMYFMAIFNGAIALLVAILIGILPIDLSFGFFSMFNSVIMYISIYYYHECLKIMPLAKITPFLYIGTLTVFVCGVAFAGEALYLTDIIGSLLIVSFNVYNSYYPIKND